MREVKFKAWNKKNKYWMTDFTLSSDGNYVYEGGETWNRDEFEIVQYTGWKDSAGKEIFEDFIVLATSEYYPMECGVFVVKFSTQYSHIHLARKIDSDAGLPISWGCWSELKIVGNIYENPELLK